MEEKDINFFITELLSTKFCHDLAGPIGGINNGIELLKEDGDEPESALQLLELSGKEALSRLQMFRQVYGMAAAEGVISLNEIKTLVNSYFANSKLAIEWQNIELDPALQSYGRMQGKLILNIILVTASCLIGAGKIKISLEKIKNTKKFIARGEAIKIKVDEKLNKILSGDFKVEDFDTKTIQAFVTQLQAKKLGKVIKLQSEENFIEISVDNLQV